jgi:hypothetical protein
LKREAAAARTLTENEPVRLALVPLTLCAPALMSVAAKVRVPLLKVLSAGRTTPLALSLLVKCTVPA